MNRRAITAPLAFLAMESMAYAAHRWVMHGVGWVLHRSHHARSAGALEANDAFPVVFASLTVLTVALASRHRSLGGLRAAGAGVTAYGAAYGFVHDIYIHARLGRLPRVRPLEYLKEAHRIHHLFGGEPYGMLVPIVPAGARRRAAKLARRASGLDPLSRGRSITGLRRATETA
ncbi:MAG: sterol desaturase family protein [Acidimicrobiales bacterium]